MRVLVVNTGSSTLKLRVVDDGDEVAATIDIDPWDGGDAPDAFASVLEGVGSVDAVGHRVVHGGRELVDATVVDDAVRDEIASLTPMAPLHQPRAVAGIDAARRAVTDVPHLAAFDTAFHATMPAAARTYALPRAWRQAWPLERYGFHGLSHAWAARQAGGARRVITCHLGAGASLCAVLDGRSIDTTMGFTPLEGLVMATRSGSIDPGLLLWLLTDAGLDAGEVDEALNHDSGLAGLAGIPGGDLREVLAARADGDPDATLAFDVYLHALLRGIGSMAAVLGGVDAIVLTGGVGEHAAPVRDAVIDGVAFLRAEVLVVPAREELEIARQVRAALA